MATYSEALATIHEPAVWTASFGFPGEGGYVEYHRANSGERWVISNGPYDAMAPFNWQCKRVD